MSVHDENCASCHLPARFRTKVEKTRSKFAAVKFMKISLRLVIFNSWIRMKCCDRFLLTLFWLVLMYSSGVILFMRGFLLTRSEIAQQSNVEDQISCCLEPKFRKIIVLVIDALRYDFAVHHNVTDVHNLPGYANKLPVIKNLVAAQSGVLYRFIADPPTTTMQRLKGLTTGSLPTFIDAGSNFATDEITEDNILVQAKNSGMNIIHVGDDTWAGLFPKIFAKSYPYPSFDVWDLDTVDKGVELHLPTEMMNHDWNVLIAHCLGVDHCGHRYGPEHPQMASKLHQMNQLIETVIANMDNDTLLLVLGDHGMTKTGDHGGDSYNETTAALFAYSHKRKFTSKESTMSQIDLVPTLALILGIPIPFSNLGTVNLDLIYPDHVLEQAVNSSLSESIENSFYCDALFLNIQQVWRYLTIYQQIKSLPEKYQELESLYTEALELYESFGTRPLYQKCLVNANLCPDAGKRSKFVEKSQQFLTETKTMCKSIWADFNVPAMATGLLTFATTIAINYVLFASLPTFIRQDSDRFSLHLIGLSLGCAFGLAFELISTWTAVALLFLSCAFFLRKLPHLKLADLHISNLVAPSVMALLYTSNSFVVEEPHVIHFVTQSLIWGSVLLNKTPRMLSLLLSILTRLGLGYHRCREEQLPHCQSHQLHRSLTSLSHLESIVPAIWRLTFALGICAAILLAISKLRATSKWISLPWILAAAHWIVQFTSVVIPDRIPEAFLVIVPRLFYLISSLVLSNQVCHLVKRKMGEPDPIWGLITTLAAFGAILAGDGLTPGVAFILGSLVVCRFLVRYEGLNGIFSSLYACLSLHGFFATGHHTSLASIPWEAAFVGFSQSGASNVVPALLVSFSTAFSALLHPVALAAVLEPNKNDANRLERAWIYHLLFYAIRLFGCMLAGYVHRRHLMVWKIFAPRLLYELLLFAATSLSTLFVAAVPRRTQIPPSSSAN